MLIDTKDFNYNWLPYNQMQTKTTLIF